jgi:hypothetical protein
VPSILSEQCRAVSEDVAERSLEKVEVEMRTSLPRFD